MLKRYLSALLLIVVAVACSKDKLETKPRIEITDINTTDVFPGQNVLITLRYDDKEGDLGNGTITYIRNRLNIKPIPDAASNDKVDTITSPLPDFPKTSTGEVELSIPHDFLSEDPNDNDTMHFRIFVVDVAGNSSDTLTTDQIVEIQN